MPGTIPKLDAFFRTPEIRNKYKNALNNANRHLRVFIKDFGEDHDKKGTLILSPSSSVQPLPPEGQQGILGEGADELILGEGAGETILGES